MIKVFAEVGIGNGTLFSTEYEDGENEYRVPEFVIPDKINGFYLRVWVFKKVFVFSLRDGLETKIKDRNKFKLLFGISGEN